VNEGVNNVVCCCDDVTFAGVVIPNDERCIVLLVVVVVIVVNDVVVEKFVYLYRTGIGKWLLCITLWPRNTHRDCSIFLT
jgi:hypothetical protein